MAQGNVLWKCCIRTLKENRSRTIVTILGVALATGLITAVTCLCMSLLSSYTEYVKQTNGDAHATFVGVEKKELKRFFYNQSVQETWIARREGYVSLESSPLGNVRNFLSLYSVDTDWFSHHDKGIRLYSGRLPENEDEIVLNRQLSNKLGMDIKIGDEITLKVGKRVRNGQEVGLGEIYVEGEEILPRFEKKYRIVGMTDEDSIECFEMARRRADGYYACAYRAFTYLDEEKLRDEVGNLEEMNDMGALYDISVRYQKSKLKKYKAVNLALLEIPESIYDRVFGWKYYQLPSEEEILSATKIAKDVRVADAPFELIMLESGNIINQDTYPILLLLLLVLLVLVFAGVFCINNSFDLTFTERVRLYGMMASIGTTKGQRRKMVLYEGVVIGAYGIPLGLFLGVFFTAGLAQVANLILRRIDKNMLFKMRFQVSVQALVLASLLAAFMIWLSASESAAHAARITPVMAIRSNADIKSKKGKRIQRVSKLVKKIFGVSGNLAILNYRRAKVKYRASVTSVAISVILFVGMSFMGMLYAQREENLLSDTNCQLEMSCYHGEKFDEYFMRIKEIVNEMPGIREAELSTVFTFRAKEDEIPYLPGKSEKANSTFCIRILDEKSFMRFCERADVNYEEAKGKGIVNAAETVQTQYSSHNGVRKKVVTGESLAHFQKGDVLHGSHIIYGEKKGDDWERKVIPIEVGIAGQADDVFALCEPFPTGLITIYVGESYQSSHPEIAPLKKELVIQGCFLGDDVNALEDAFYQEDFAETYIHNYNREWQKLRYTEILLKVFLSSFLCIIALIGITNIINAIGTNMELRSQEFAKLKSIGMSNGQLHGMVRAEMVILGAKGLFYGAVIGTGVSYGLYRFFWESSDKNFDFAFQIPFLEIILCVICVGTLLAIITENHIRRMGKKSIVDTIRNENL